jgi:hypothetical protein
VTGFLATLLLDPKTLGVILGSFGTAIGWLIKSGRDCRRNEAVLTERLDHMRERIIAAEATITTLCNLLKRETHVG